MKKSRDKILKILEENQNTIKSYGVKRLGLFGSCARGECSEASDLDFVVEFDKKSFDLYMDLKAFLEELFGCQVDLVLADTIKPRLRTTILEEAVHVPGL
jgi:predicted nucleotidyltransferase